ncbi:MAG: response regulator [Eubacteriales bacterium]|nr:response regulator [Eubacteriales bacterium]
MERIIKGSHRLYLGAIVLAAVIFTAVFFVKYMDMTRRTGDKEVESQMAEVYGQVSGQFTELAQKNWNLLQDGALAFRLSQSQELADDYIAHMKEQWKFNKWLFIDDNGSYIDMTGNIGYLNLGKDFSLLVQKKESIVVDGTLAGSDPVLLFAAPVRENVYKGFAYTAVALAYDKRSMRQVLEDTSYEGASQSYLLYPDGRVLLSLQDSPMDNGNLFTLLKTVRFQNTNYEAIHDRIRGGMEGSCRYSLGEENYYLYCRPVGFQDWVLVGIVPQRSVGVYLNQILKQIVFLSGLSFGLVMAAILVYLYYRNRRAILLKDQELAYRRQLFEILSGKDSNLFMVLLPHSYQAEYVSSNSRRLIGIDSKEIMKDIRILKEGECQEKVLLDREDLDRLPMGETVRLQSVWKHKMTGEQVWFEEQVYHVRIGSIERYIIVWQDRTKEREGRLQLKTALDIAKTANEAKSAFLSNMSHDIRTPMNVIIGFLPLLERDAENPEKVREYARKIGASSQHLLGLINDVLDMSKIESGKTSLNIQEFRLAEMMEGLAMIIRPQASAKGQLFEIYTREIRHEILIGDEMKLNQIMINLLTNAVKYTPKGGRISLTVTQLPQKMKNSVTVRFEVRDNGIGMSKEYQKKIFEPFSREDGRKSGSIRGTGLGMAIVKSLLDLMGGSIQVDSSPGKGSVFTVEIGLKIRESEVDQEFWSRHGLTRALVVDDDPDICSAVSQAVTDSGLEMESALGGEEAVRKIRQGLREDKSFDLAVIDWKMPGMDGLETAKRIRSAVSQRIPILLLTAYDWTEIEEEARAAGVNGFLAKPFFMSSFREAVEGLCHRAETQEAMGEKESGLQGMHVLMAEDYELNAEILAGILEMYGATSDVCVNGLETLKRFQASEKGEYDLILMDIQMPVMDGCESVREIRSCGHPDAQVIPVIAMSANAFSEDVQRAREAGMDAYLTKPVDVKALERTLCRVLEEKRGAAREG